MQHWAQEKKEQKEAQKKGFDKGSLQKTQKMMMVRFALLLSASHRASDVTHPVLRLQTGSKGRLSAVFSAAAWGVFSARCRPANEHADQSKS